MMNIIYTEKKVEPHKIEEKFPINNARDKDEKKTSTIIDRDSGTPEEIENSIRGIDLFDTGEKTYILYYPEEYLAIPIIEIIIKEYKGTVVTRELSIKETETLQSYILQKMLDTPHFIVRTEINNGYSF